MNAELAHFPNEKMRYNGHVINFFGLYGKLISRTARITFDNFLIMPSVMHELPSNITLK